MKETLEEMVTRIKAENNALSFTNAVNISKLEFSEHKYSIVCEALENLLDDIDNSAVPRGAFYKCRKDGRKALEGGVDSDR